ncbi:MAG: tRNA dihydrouridine synthase DusB [Tannerellaceae bacterium]|jgi:nifR3 family TIM-barrel protein|nr:tRNA dihydrouridine synthase DusB [Tannerellaceae bacterium]
MKIGSINFSNQPLFLAPMEDVTDASFRHICKNFGADMVYTEFVSSDALIRSINKTKLKLEISENERPVAIQIYGKDPAVMRDAAQICEAANPDIIDINFGCPVKKIAGKGAGAGMLRNIPLMLEITKEVVNAVKIPVTVKTRLGWDMDSLIIVELAEKLQDCGISAICIHGRTRSQMYAGKADWTLIRQVKENSRMRIPVIGNGDITTPEGCKEKFDLYGVDAVMVGRGSIGQPWIFCEMKHYLETASRLPLQTFSYYMQILKEQIIQSIEKLDERRGILHIRRHLAATPLFKNIPNFKKTRVEMLRAITLQELFEIMDGIASGYFMGSRLDSTENS